MNNAYNEGRAAAEEERNGRKSRAGEVENERKAKERNGMERTKSEETGDFLTVSKKRKTVERNPL